jgi:hypothetical protein
MFYSLRYANTASNFAYRRAIIIVCPQLNFHQKLSTTLVRPNYRVPWKLT